MLKKSGSVNSSKWPVVTQVDEVLLQSFSYLMDASHSFRVRQKTYLTQKSKDKNAKPIAKPTHGTVYVAKQFPLWQSIILNNMKALYEV